MAGHVNLRRLAEGVEARPRETLKTTLRLLSYLRPYSGRVGVGVAFVVLSSASYAAGPVVVGRAVDVIVARQAGRLPLLVGALLSLATVQFLAQREQIRRIGAAGQFALADVRERIFAKVQALPLAFFDRAEAGDLMSRLVNDVDTLNQFLGQGFAQFLGNLVGMAGVVIAMLALEWRLGLATLVVVPAIWLTVRGFGLLAHRAYRETRETIGDVSAELQEELAGIRVTQSFARGEATIARFMARNAANRDANIAANAVSSAFTPALDVLSAVTTAIVAGYGGWIAFFGLVSIGVVVAFISFSQGFFRQISQMSAIYAQAQAALAGGERIFQLLDMPGLADEPDAVEMPHIAGRIRFEHVDFAYPGRAPSLAQAGDGADTTQSLPKEEPLQVLFDVDFEVEPGSVVALVGPTGAGKTTIVNLVLRFYDPTEGRIMIDGLDVRSVTRASLRRQMAVVLQEPFLFAGTVADNIRYGQLAATRSDIEAAARLVGAHDFVMNLPNGYDTELGERGGGLSQGQKQLIALARAVIADPRILLLDEATASVDTRTEQLIQRALARLLHGRTSVVVAHRLSTIREADDILVMDEGRIVERGRHEELLAAGGLYAQLYRRQFGGAT